MDAVLRRADESDLDRIMALERTTFPDDAWSEAIMRSELVDPHGHYLVVVDGVSAELLGYAGLRSPRGGEQADIQTVAVAEAARRRGIGRRLIVAQLAEARARGAREVFLEVRADNPAAHALYEGLGFADLARRARYYPGGVDAIVMRRGFDRSEGAA